MSVLFTIGYEGTDIERLIATLNAAGVKQLADVRAVAISRKKGFSKTKLSQALAASDIEYLHFRDLGDPKPGREAARRGDIELFREIYTKHMASDVALSDLASLEKVASAKATCLLCFERDPSTCHRRIIANRLEEKGMKTFDLFGDKPESYVKRKSEIPRHYPSESVAAA